MEEILHQLIGSVSHYFRVETEKIQMVQVFPFRQHSTHTHKIHGTGLFTYIYHKNLTKCR